MTPHDYVWGKCWSMFSTYFVLVIKQTLPWGIMTFLYSLSWENVELGWQNTEYYVTHSSPTTNYVGHFLWNCWLFERISWSHQWELCNFGSWKRTYYHIKDEAKHRKSDFKFQSVSKYIQLEQDVYNFQAQTQLQLSWTELALLSLLTIFGRPCHPFLILSPPGKVSEPFFIAKLRPSFSSAGLS